MELQKELHWKVQEGAILYESRSWDLSSTVPNVSKQHPLAVGSGLLWRRCMWVGFALTR